MLRHETNRGLSAARNTGIRAATAPVVAFLDDDCEPEPEWARELIDAYEDGVIGVGGPLVPTAPEGFMLGFLRRNNPLVPLEMNLAHSEGLLYRLYLYVLRQWAAEERHDKREVYMLVGANMSFLRALIAETGFDERFRFGADDLDLALQLRHRFPTGRLVVTPDAVVRHHFEPSLRDTLRRSRCVRPRLCQALPEVAHHAAHDLSRGRARVRPAGRVHLRSVPAGCGSVLPHSCTPRDCGSRCRAGSLPACLTPTCS